eukprot:747641-Hanusia_phi.AAC.2
MTSHRGLKVVLLARGLMLQFQYRSCSMIVVDHVGCRDRAARYDTTPAVDRRRSRRPGDASESIDNSLPEFREHEKDLVVLLHELEKSRSHLLELESAGSKGEEIITAQTDVISLQQQVIAALQNVKIISLLRVHLTVIISSGFVTCEWARTSCVH